MPALAASPVTSPSLLARLADAADQTAWAEFVRVYGPLVYREVRRRGVATADAEDVTQAVFVRVLAGMGRFRYAPDRGRFRDWLGTVVRNEAARHWRDGRVLARAVPADVLDEANAAPAADPEWADAFYAHLLAESLAACEPRFDPDTWAAFVGVWQHDRPAAEVAARFRRTVEWVYVAKSRCLAAVVAEVERLSADGPARGLLDGPVPDPAARPAPPPAFIGPVG